MDWDKLARPRPRRSASRRAFPYPSLPHPKQATGGQVFPQMQIEMFPRLERFDVDFDLPDAFLPEFPPAIFLQNRPELGDVSRGEVVSINNYYRAVQGHPDAGAARRPAAAADAVPAGGVQPDRRPQERRSRSLGVTCLDCHVNGHTTGQFHLNPDIRPAGAALPARHGQPARRVQPADPRLEAQPALGRGLHRVRAAHGLLQRRPDPRHEEGHEHPRPRPGQRTWRRCRTCSTSRPRPSSTLHGPARSRRRRPRASCAARSCSSARRSAPSATRRRSTSTTRCTTCTWSASSNEPGDGPIKTFTLRGIKDSPPYLHDGRCLTLEDTVEFFNLVLRTKLTKQEKADLAAFLRVL